MLTMKVAIASTTLALWAASAGAATVTPEDALGQVGHAAKVCGVVASSNYAPDSRAHPTFLTLVNPGQPNPTGALTAVIYGTDRAKFGNPEVTLSGQRVCVTGFVSYFRHRPELILSDPSQLSYYPPPSIAELR
jgi:DNA/RNA endonuclease YhcR with UshA esterase domain